MEEGQAGYGYSGQLYGDISIRLRDLEEKQRILKDRLLLIGQNLIDVKEDMNQDFLEIKKEIEIIKQKIERIISFVETISGEFSNFARKEDIEILTKQAKMFQPLELVGKKEFEELKKRINTSLGIK